MTELETNSQRLLREIRAKRDRLDAMVKAALARVAADPAAEPPDPVELAERFPLRLPDIAERIGRLERRRGMSPSESR